MICWKARHPQFRPEMLGYLIDWLDDRDPRSAREQLDIMYHPYGGRWHSEGFRLAPINEALLYPGDPPQPVLAETTLRHERILFYPHQFVAIVQPDGEFVIQRMD